MTLLECVNTCLSALGEARVTSTAVRHPTVDLIKSTIEMKKRQLLEPGLWFNVSEVKMYPSELNEMEYPANAISVLGYKGETLIPRNGMLFDVDANSSKFYEAKQMRVTYNLDFEDLPECVANVVMCRTVQEVYSGDLGVDANVSRFQMLEQQAMAVLEMMHLRNKRYNTRQRPGFWRYRSALNG